MERTITFIAEHKKREFEQMKEGNEVEDISPQEPQIADFDPDSTQVE